ncbi:universal stress protein [Hymenobacter koreensis]|uniref:UspA domain-containing protein n=1 Tax=Hymenobacter koreensis TaxID=1084523 RepID=A0ABP8J8K4_9BACT
MENLLVLTDLSPAAENARRYAAQVAALLGARVVLLHVHQTPVLTGDLVPGLGSALQYNREQMAYALEGIAGNMIVPTVAEVVEGTFGPALNTALARYRPRLVILGLSAAENYVEAMLTNRALPLLQYGNVPVLLVPASAVSSRIPRHVVLGIDGEAFAVAPPASELFQELLNTWQAQLVLTCAATPDTSVSRTEALRTVQHSGLLDSETKLTFQQPLAETPEAGLLRTATQHEADLLVLVARRRSFLGQLFHRSVTARVLRRVTQPVLLLPTTDAVVEKVTPAQVAVSASIS